MLTRTSPKLVLMSSHREYESDFKWSWLRNDGPGARMLRFEPAADDESVYELVVPREWSTRVRASNLNVKDTH